jgi:hypothetical protein
MLQYNITVLANYKTIHASLSLSTIIFWHDCPLTVKPANLPPRPLSQSTWSYSLPVTMLLSALSILIAGLLSSEFPEGLTNYLVLHFLFLFRASPHNPTHTFAVYIAFPWVHYNISIQTCLYIMQRNCITTPNAYTSRSSLRHLAMYKYM